MAVSPDWRPEELLQFSTRRDSQAVHCVQQRRDCWCRQGDQGIVMGYEDCWVINDLHVPTLLPDTNT